MLLKLEYLINKRILTDMKFFTEFTWWILSPDADDADNGEEDSFSLILRGGDGIRTWWNNGPLPYFAEILINVLRMGDNDGYFQIWKKKSF